MRDILAEERDRQKKITTAWKYYEGQHPKPLQVDPGKLDDNVIANFARFIVDQGVSFLFGDDLKFDLDENTNERTPDEEWLDEVWRANDKMATLYELGMNGAVAGHAFLKIVLDPAEEYPRLVVLDPTNVTAFSDPHDVGRVIRYRIQYPITGADGRQKTFRQTIRREGNVWTILEEEAPLDGADFRPIGPPITWPYPFAPIVDCQNLVRPNLFWGLADLEEDVLGLNRALNFILSNNQRINKHFGDPQTIAKGVELKDIKRAVGSIWTIPGGTKDNPTDVFNLEMQSDGAFSMEQYKRVKESLHETAEVPEVATGKMESTGQLSGVALAILYGPMVKRTGRKRFTYGGLFVETNRRLLIIGKRDGTQRSEIHWPEIVPGDRVAEGQALLQDQEMGASKDTLLQKRGYDPEKEREKRELEADELIPNPMQGLTQPVGGKQAGEDEE